jgi:dTDP-glucose 4,6-dehydratase
MQGQVHGAPLQPQWLVTGGAGFIGSNLLLRMVPRYGDSLFVNADSLTYAGNLSNLKDLEGRKNYRFERVDLRVSDEVGRLFERFAFTGVIHLAAESHVDRSIVGPADFVNTNINGTFHLLERVREAHQRGRKVRFHHVSTDEVFGSLGAAGHFSETSPYRPNSPYAASKAAADHLVRAYHHTYGLDVVLTNCSNNYGPYQFPEKLIPLVIANAREDKPLPVYGDGKNVRDWLYVEDHCAALEEVFFRGASGASYNIGGHQEIENLELVRLICRVMDERLGGAPRERLITFVKDRPGHDRRYAIDATRIEKELGWRPSCTLPEGIRKTVDWYLEHDEWLKACTSGAYRDYYERMYTQR